MTALSKEDVNASLQDLRTKKAFLDLIEVATIAAAGADQTDATSLLAGINVVTAANDAKGVILPRAKKDRRVEVINTVSNKTLLVYPDTGSQINALTATTGAFSQVGGARAIYVCDADLHWYVAAANLTGTATSSSTAELDTLHSVTGGVVSASKAVVVDANKHIDTIGIANGGLKLGVSGSEVAVNATALEINNACDTSANTEIVTSTNVIAATESGMTYFLNSATEFISTLPAPAQGLKFTFIVTAAPSGASYTIVTATSANIIIGQQQSVAGDAGDFGTADDTITFVDGQSVAGDRVDVISDGTNWFAYAQSKVAAGITFTQAS